MTGPKRVVCLVADGFGVGEAPDAAQYGDVGSNTLGNTAAHVGGLKLPNLQRLGLGNLGKFSGISSNETAIGVYGRLQERSLGKDTTTGHWELAGLVTSRAFQTFPQGFPAELLNRWAGECQLPGYLGNTTASGTDIIAKLGEQSVASGKPIVYTSADSVFQVAAHEQAFGLERLYKVCIAARRLTLPLQIGRVIARPFTGPSGQYTRTEARRDYSIAPGRNLLDVLSEKSIATYGVGKIEDIFDHRGLAFSEHTGNNRDSLAATLNFLEQSQGTDSFIFTNLVDFDMLYGHRRDPVGYAAALAELDTFLPKLLERLGPDDALFLTSDHGCDPTYRGTDHTREFVPLIGYAPKHGRGAVGDRTSFADLSATILDLFQIDSLELPDIGTSIFTKYEQ